MIVVEEAGGERDPHSALRPGAQVIVDLVAVPRSIAGVMAMDRGRDPVLDQPGGVIERVEVAVERRDAQHLYHPALEGLVGTAELHRAHSPAMLVGADQARENHPVLPAELSVRRMPPPELSRA